MRDDAPLRTLPVLVLDCQASGATPAHGDLLEIAWAVCDGSGTRSEVRSSWVLPETERPISRAVRELTGWDESCLAAAARAEDVLAELGARAREVAREGGMPRAPTAIHWARFEMGFLAPREGAEPLPLDVACVHAVARRVHPDLPRRSLRALAGYLGHPAGTARRARGHVEATAFVWKAFVADLEARGVATWSDLATWLAKPAPRAPAKRTFSFGPEQRRAVPRGPGVYRFVRRSGDVLYVGKAVDLRRRVASHFTAAASRAGERALEMLTQVADVEVTTAATTVEAALLEHDEIKRLDPPYNVQLRRGSRRVYFASRDLADVSEVEDEGHPVGPLPSARAVAALAAVRAVVGGAVDARGAGRADGALYAQALGVPLAFAPDATTFAAGLAAFVGALPSAVPRSRIGWMRLGRALAAKGAEDGADGADDADDAEREAPDSWTPEAVAEQLARAVVAAAAVLDRARRIRLLANARVAFTEAGRSAARTLVIRGGEVVATFDGEALDAAPGGAVAVAFDVDRYDRLRVLATELARLRATPGARVRVRVRGHVLGG